MHQQLKTREESVKEWHDELKSFINSLSKRELKFALLCTLFAFIKNKDCLSCDNHGPCSMTNPECMRRELANLNFDKKSLDNMKEYIGEEDDGE